jgi:hypothetical protein
MHAVAAACAACSSQPDSFHPVLCQPFLRVVIKLGRAWALMRCHGLRVFEGAAVQKIGRDPRCPKTVIADRSGDPGGGRTPADHPPGVRLRHGLPGADLCGIVGFEILLRWNSSVMGSIQPDQFISLAEISGLIVPLGR